MMEEQKRAERCLGLMSLERGRPLTFLIRTLLYKIVFKQDMNGSFN